MKNLIPILIFCVVSQTAAPKRQSDRVHDGFVGPVKKVAVFWIPVSGSSYPAGSKCRQMTNEYDETGRITRHSLYPGSCGSDEIREDYTYSRDGDRTTKIQQIRGADSPPPPPPVVNPNARRQTGPPKKVVKYDDLGRLIEDGVVQADGQFSYKTTYTYDSKGRLIETVGFDGDTQPSSRRVYSYSGDQRVPSEFAYFDREGKIHDRTTYSDYDFNSKGDWIKRTQSSEQTIYLRSVPRTSRSVSMSVREFEYYQ